MTTHRTDAAIKQDILDELKLDPKVTETEIGVTVKDGAVTLTGNIPLYSHKHAANQAAKRIKSVRSIVDNVQVGIPALMGGMVNWRDNHLQSLSIRSLSKSVISIQNLIQREPMRD